MSSAPDIVRMPESFTRHAEWKHAADDRVCNARQRKAFVDCRHRLAAQMRLDDGAGVERCIFQCAHHVRRTFNVAPDVPGDPPVGSRQRDRGRQTWSTHSSTRVENAAERAFGPIAPRHVVGNGRAVRGVGARPVPCQECVLQRLVSGVGVEVCGSLPANAWIVQLHPYARMGRDRPPAMPSRLVQMHDLVVRHRRGDPYGATNAPWHRHRQFVDVDHQSIAVAQQAAWADSQGIAIAPQVASRPLRQ